MALIGVILLIGIVKKNAILMIDFALDRERKEGKSPEEAIFEACLMRFRPIMMTTMAALFGALPLILLTGEGSELRRPLGISIVGGLIVSQILTLYTTPVVYLYLDRFRLFCLRILATEKQPLASTGIRENLKRIIMKKLLINIFPVILIVIFGCSSGRITSVRMRRTSSSFKELKGWREALPRDQEIRTKWWEAFGDPILNSLAEQVNVSNQSIALAESQYRQALGAGATGPGQLLSYCRCWGILYPLDRTGRKQSKHCRSASGISQCLLGNGFMGTCAQASGIK